MSAADVTLLLQQSRHLLADYALLAVLDLRSAARQLMMALAAVLMATVLGATAWLACVVAAVAWAGGSVDWPPTLAGAALVNLLAAAGLVWWLRSRLATMPFAATVRQLRGETGQHAGEGAGHE